MMYLLLAFISLLVKRKVRNWSENIILDRFGFEPGGSFEFNITNIFGDQFFISLCLKSECQKLMKSKSLCNLIPEDAPEITSIQNIKNNTIYFSGHVTKRSTLYPLLSSCDQKHSKYDLVLTFHNQKTFLDFYVYPTLILKPLFLFILIIIAIIWVINWVSNLRVKNYLHSHFTITLFSTILYTLFHILELYHFSLSDSSTKLKYFRIIFQITQRISLFSIILMICNGLCLIRTEVDIHDKFCYIIVSIIATIPTSFLELRENTAEPLRIECISIFVALRIYLLLKSIQSYNKAIDYFFQEHSIINLETIKEEAKELKQFHRYFAIMFCLLCTILLVCCLDDCKFLDFYQSQIVQDAVSLTVICMAEKIAWLQPVAIVMENEVEDKRNGIKWEEMKLEEPK